MANNIMSKKYKMWRLPNCKPMNDMALLGVKQQPAWEAELIDPQSKFVLAHVQGARDETLIRRLLEDGAARLHNRHEVALFTDGLPAYRTLFPEIFGRAYYPPRQGPRGPHPKARYRIPRTAPMCRLSSINAATV